MGITERNLEKPLSESDAPVTKVSQDLKSAVSSDEGNEILRLKAELEKANQEKASLQERLQQMSAASSKSEEVGGKKPATPTGGPPPPPPPPPPAPASSISSKKPVNHKIKPPPGDPQALLMDAIKNAGAKSLRSTSSSERSAESAEPSLMGQISGFKFKDREGEKGISVEEKIRLQKEKKKEIEEKKKEESPLFKKMNAIREAQTGKPEDEEDSDDEFDDDSYRLGR